VGERFTYGGWQFTVSAKEGARIDRVRLMRLKGGTASGKENRSEHRTEPSPPPKA
jgi:hypothetical protein